MKKPQIDYPCHWSYRIIGTDKSALRRAAADAAGGRPHTLTESNTSSGGKYRSLNLEVLVENEAERLEVFKCLQHDEAVKIVL